MKKLNFLFLTVIGLLCSISVKAYDFEVDGIYYNIESEVEKKVQVTYKGFGRQDLEVYKDEVVIPEVVCYNDVTYSVTSINDNTFWDNQKLTSVVIGNNVITIGEYAFEYCYNLEKVVVGNSVKEIGNSAFYDCKKLKNVINLSSLTFNGGSNHYGYIVYYADGYGGTVINAPNGAMVGDFLFSTAYSKNNLVKYFGNDTEIILPDNYKGEYYSIGSEAFENCDNITSVVISDGVISIGNYAFYDCDKLVNVEISNSVTDIWSHAFSSCDKLANIDIPNSVETIGDYAFCYLKNLTSIDIPSSVKTIGQMAFQDCGLTSITMNSGETKIGQKAFARCYNLERVNITDLAAWCKIYFETYDSNPVHIAKSIYMNGEEITELVIPEGVTSIRQWAFVNCNNIKSVTIANSTKSVGNWAFSACKGLTTVKFGNGVETIWAAFEDCENLSHVEISPNLKGIYSGAFANCYNLTEFIIPAMVNYIDYSAFVNCSGLTKITSFIPAENLFELDKDAFSKVDKSKCILYVPMGTKAKYASTSGWNDFTNIVELNPSYDLNVSTVGYSTLYLDYSTEIPEGVEVYTAKEVDGFWLKMEQVKGVLPANTGVVVKAPAGTYTFVQTNSYAPAIMNNLFKGSTVDEYVNVSANASAFVLSMVNDEVGMYLATLTDGSFFNNANNSYLFLDNNKLGLSEDELNAQFSLRFYFDGVTGVDKVQTESDVNHATYDLYGRKVNKITTPGLYIVNGKKVWVK